MVHDYSQSKWYSRGLDSTHTDAFMGPSMSEYLCALSLSLPPDPFFCTYWGRLLTYILPVGSFNNIERGNDTTCVQNDKHHISQVMFHLRFLTDFSEWLGSGPGPKWYRLTMPGPDFPKPNKSRTGCPRTKYLFKNTKLHEFTQFISGLTCLVDAGDRLVIFVVSKIWGSDTPKAR